jgi:hypothetical protein
MAAHAFVTYIIKNDSYLPGALLLAHALREMETPADIVCLATAEVSENARASLGELFDRVIAVEPLRLDSCNDQHRQHLSQVLTRVNALRLGADGDLGCNYAKVALLDADLLPLRCYDHLFALPTPAGVINEHAEYLKGADHSGRYVADRSMLRWGRWRWHSVYRRIPHGERIPSAITNRVLTDPDNYGVNSALLVLAPDMEEYRAIVADLERPSTQGLCAGFRWPDMQYLTARWTGRWHNVDACFAGIGGYPSIDLLFGTHFAGLKPWQTRRDSVCRCYSRFPDFQRWYHEFGRMMQSYPGLRSNHHLVGLERRIRDLPTTA